MNKGEIVAYIADDAGITKADAGRALDAFIHAVTDSLRNGDSVQIAGFGTFNVRARSARTGRNPQTGQTLFIKASKNVGFKAGKALKDSLN